MDNSAKNTIIDYIYDHPAAVISVVDINGNPAGSVIYIAADDNLNVYFLTKRDTDKAAAIIKHSVVAFTLHSEGSQTLVQLQGEANEITDPVEGERAFVALDAIQSDKFRLPISKLNAGPYVTYKVVIRSAVLTNFGTKDEKGNVTRMIYNKDAEMKI